MSGTNQRASQKRNGQKAAAAKRKGEKKSGVIRHDRRGLAKYAAERAVRFQSSLDAAVAEISKPRRIK